MRIFRPSDAPPWLAQVLTSIENLFRQIMPAPFSLWRLPTADLPAAADYTGALVWDETTSLLSWSNGSAWVSPSLSSHVHAASAITFAPAGGIAAANVQAAIVELDTEKAAAAHTHVATDVTDFSEAVDDRVSALLTGTVITRTYDDALGTLTLSIADDAVSNAMLANMAAATIKGRASGAGTGDPTDLTSAQVFTILGGTTGAGAVTLASSPSITSPTMTGGTGMTGSWNRTLLLDASFPTLVLRSNWPGTATDHGAIGYDGSVDTLFFFVGATTADATVATAKMFQISPTGFGYATGSGGAVTQITSKSTAVTLNKANGSITMHAAALAANTSVAFTLTNSTIAATDVVNVTIKSGATSGAYVLTVQATAAGSCSIMVRNVSAGSLSEALVLNFAVLKAVTS